MTSDREYWTLEELADLLRVSRTMLRDLARAGRFEAIRVGRAWRIPASEVQRIRREGLPAGGDDQDVPQE